jgi:hypothetical protein
MLDEVAAMDFRHPLAWFWALLVVLLVWLYCGRFASRREELATFWLWQRALARRPAWFRLRFWLSLAAQIALLLLLVAALAQPARRESLAVRRNIVLIVDVSASMSASDVSPSRFGKALLIAQKTVGDLQLGERMAVVTAGSAVRTACQLTADRERLSATLVQLRPTGGRSRMIEAVEMGRRMLDGKPNRRIYLITDGGFRGAAELSRADDVTVRLVGEGGDNLAITRFEARPSAVAVAEHDVMIEVGNFSGRSRSVPLQLNLGDRILYRETLELAAGEMRQIVRTVPVPRSNVLAVRLDIRDDLPLDDSACLLVRARRQPVARLLPAGIPEADAAIRAAVSSDPRI